MNQEIEGVRALVAARFPVYETRVTPQAVVFLVQVDPLTMEAKFEDLRIELVPKNYIPTLALEGGEHAILVQRRQSQRFLGRRVNLILLAFTLATTTWAGALLWAGYAGGGYYTLGTFAMGSLFFTLPLMGILAIHEMGHYFMAKRYKVHASLPFFIPAPLTILGTFGAVISMRDPMPSRKALIDIGAAGPIVGLLAAIPVTLIGMVLTGAYAQPIPLNTGGNFDIGYPLLYQILGFFVPIPGNVLLHPTAFAGWVGLFVTALNLLPAGQLDGGHVARAVLGEHAKFLSYAAIVLMLIISFWYQGWMIIALFILFMGARHPPPLNDLTRIDAKRYGLGAAVAVILLLSFVAVPLVPIEPRAAIAFEASDAPGEPVEVLNASIPDGTAMNYTFRVANVGNMETEVNLTLDVGWPPSTRLTVVFGNVTVNDEAIPFSDMNAAFSLDSTECANVTVRIDATNRPPIGPWGFRVEAKVRVEGLQPFTEVLNIDLQVL